MTDPELLERAAKSVGITLTFDPEAPVSGHSPVDELNRYWNPLFSDGEAQRLSVKRRMTVRVEDYGASARIEGNAWHGCKADLYGGIEAATRRAIVRAAAAMA